jgi:2-C-methyl-D-erythritol 4-phosphate cytidylyltransferase
MVEHTIEALGSVVESDRGSLPFALIHGEALVACASWALGEAGVTPVDFTSPWTAVVEAQEPYVLHDPLCPMTPADFVAQCVETAVDRGAVVVAVRQVTDTVKTVTDGLVGDTLDRSELVEVTSPIVLPAAVAASLDAAPRGDFAAIAAQLAARFPVVTLESPPEGRRVADLDDLRLLEALTTR